MRRTPLAGAALVIAAALGRFGTTKDNSPEAFDAGDASRTTKAAICPSGLKT